MACLRFYLFAAALCSLALLGYADTDKTILKDVDKLSVITTTKIPSSPEVTDNLSTKPLPSPPTPVPTSASNLTTTLTPTTNPKPTPPTTTTPKPTPPTTTTPKPTPIPTTTPKPTPNPAPGPTPAPEQGTWSYMDNKNVTCIVVQFAAQLNVTYPKTENNSTTLGYVVTNIPTTANVTGYCGNDTQWLQLSWLANNATSNVTNNVTLVFARNTTTNNYALRSLNVTLAWQMFVNSSTKANLVLSHGSEWLTPLATSYRCAPATRLNMTSDVTNVAGAITLSQLQEEAFRTSPGKGFSAARECGHGDVPDAVPIAVGCALAGLVVVMLVAYLVACRRNAARGYLSM